MNRIRRVGNVYQCLTSPYRKYDTGFETLLGSWTDEAMMGFDVKTYHTYKEAENDIYDMPDINWDALVNFHKDSFLMIKQIINNSLDRSGISTDFKYHMATPEQTKNRMFDRVIKGQEIMASKNTTEGFRIVYDMNDIISFVIINPWIDNLRLITDRLIKTARLNIFKKIEKECITQLIGRTDIGTTYEIILIPSIIHNWMSWRDNNRDKTKDVIDSTFRNCIRTQKLIDSTPILR